MDFEIFIMSGHSKWSQIKHKKAIEDAKKSRYFSKLAGMITIAARESKGDIEKNPKLRLAIEKAKELNMPKENIERAIKRGTGEIEGIKIEEALYEAYGPGNIGILIKTITDNKNRTAAEIKKILNKHRAKLTASGRVSFQFEEKALFKIPKESYSQELGLELIEKGVEDIQENKEITLTAPSRLFSEIKNLLEEKNIKILESSLDLVSKQKQKVDEKTKREIEELFEELDDQNEVEDIYSTMEVEDEN